MSVRLVAPGRGVRLWAALAGALLGAACASGHGASGRGTSGNASVESPANEVALPVPADLRARVLRASSIGARLFVLDTATALAWDALRAVRESPGAPRVGHHLAFLGSDAQGLPDGSVQVMFFTEEHVPRVAYRVRVIAGPVARSEVVVQNPPGVVHEPLMTLLNARQIAIEALPSMNQALNPVLIPEQGGAIAVYLMGASSQPNTAVLGRHFRVEVSPDGTEIEAIETLAGAMLEVPTADGTGQRRAALAVVAEGTEHPTEAHVFASRMADVPIYVITPRGRWRVRAAAIDYLGEP